MGGKPGEFVNVYPLIAYSCEVAIHITISWILGSGPRWYGKWHSHNIQEQGNNHSWVDIIAFLFEVFKYLFKKLFLRQIFLKSIFFLMQNSWKPGICISYGYKQSYALYWLHHDSLYTKGFYCKIYIRKWLTMYNHYDYLHICCLWLEKDPIWFWRKKVNLKL